MNKHTTKNSSGSLLVIVLVTAVIFIVIWLIGVWLSSNAMKEAVNKNSTPNNSLATNSTDVRANTTTPKEPDSASTIDSPQKIITNDGTQHFYYGEPAGQNNASPKKILITIHGTAGSAEQDYSVWKPFIKETDFALASLNWWDGDGDMTPDYSTPELMVNQIHAFLISKNYTNSDIVVFEGFSRGSANSYSIAALDQASQNPLIKAVISSSGGAQIPYYESTTKTIPLQKQPTIFKNVHWILACGGKDENPTRDGCEAMEQTKQFVTNKGATVLALLSDPNGGHGALNTSELGLVNQAFELIEEKL